MRVLRNPRSHGNKGKERTSDTDPAASIDIETVEPGKREDTVTVLKEFVRDGVDLLVIDGGDGTVRDVLTAGQTAFADAWPVLAVLPRGKTNALSVDLGVPEPCDLDAMIAAFRDGHLVSRRPLVIERRDIEASRISGFIIGAGAFTTGVRAAQDAHRLGAFGGLAVSATVAWAVLQMIFGGARNVWRRGVAMELARMPDGRSLAHSDRVDTTRRAMLLATTLRRMPAGLKPFGPERDGLKIMVIDKPRRRVFASAPLIVAGRQPDWLKRLGFHQVDAPGFTMITADELILDGELYPAGSYLVTQGSPLQFVVPRGAPA